MNLIGSVRSAVID